MLIHDIFTPDLDLTGTDEADVIISANGADMIDAGAGNDTVYIAPKVVDLDNPNSMPGDVIQLGDGLDTAVFEFRGVSNVLTDDETVITGPGNVTIADFEFGEDMLVLREIEFGDAEISILPQFDPFAITDARVEFFDLTTREKIDGSSITLAGIGWDEVRDLEIPVSDWLDFG